MTNIDQAGTFTLGDRTVNRLGYGAMQLAGPGVFGPPKDRDAAMAVLREAVARRRQSHRHQRLLRSPCHQRADPRGAVTPIRTIWSSSPRSAPARRRRRRGCRPSRQTS